MLAAVNDFYNEAVREAHCPRVFQPRQQAHTYHCKPACSCPEALSWTQCLRNFCVVNARKSKTVIPMDNEAHIFLKFIYLFHRAYKFNGKPFHAIFQNIPQCPWGGRRRMRPEYKLLTSLRWP